MHLDDTCPECGGTGMIADQGIQTQCDLCDGTGETAIVLDDDFYIADIAEPKQW